MAITADFHTHSEFSGDSDASMESMVEKAIHLGLKEYCFTDHMDYDYPFGPKDPGNIFLLDTDSYLTKAQRVKQEYADKLRISIGVELGMQPHIIDFLNNYSARNDFDFIIGSLHVCNHIDPYYPEFYQDKSEYEAYLSYFEELLQCIRLFRNYDVIGHIDYVVRYGPNKDREYSYSRYADILDEILRTTLANGRGIEVNSGGLRKGLSNPNPCIDVIRRYKELGGEIITIGSDAHRPVDISKDFSRIETILSDCGFRYYTVFHDRKPEFLPLA